VREQTTDAELQAWGVTREKMKEELLFDDLEKLGKVYKSSVEKGGNNPTEHESEQKAILIDNLYIYFHNRTITISNHITTYEKIHLKAARYTPN